MQAYAARVVLVNFAEDELNLADVKVGRIVLEGLDEFVLLDEAVQIFVEFLEKSVDPLPFFLVDPGKDQVALEDGQQVVLSLHRQVST